MNRYIYHILMFFIFIAHIKVNAQSNWQWEIVNEGKGQIKIIEFISDEVGWIEADGTLLKTVDGCETWISVSQLDNIVKIDFIDESTVWALYKDSTSKIMKSINGGYSWESTADCEAFEPQNFFAVNDSVIYAMNDTTIIKTIDSGHSWIDLSPNLVNR